MYTKIITLFSAIECLLITKICLNKSLPKVPCCDVRCDFRIQTMFGSSLSPVGCRRAHVIFTGFFVFT